MSKLTLNDEFGVGWTRHQVPLADMLSYVPGSYTSLMDAAGAGATQVNLKNKPSYAGSGIWVVVNPYSSTCEMRQVSSVSGLGAAIAALTNAHAADEPVLWIDQPFANVKWFGAVGDGSTNDAAAINLAIAEASAHGIPVSFPIGTYAIASKLNGAGSMRLYGEGQGSIIKATATFADGMIDMNGTFAENCSFENLYFDGNDKAGLCLNLDGSALNTWVNHCHFINYTDTGIYIGSGAGNEIHITHCHFDGDKGDLGTYPNYGIHFAATQHDNYLLDLVMRQPGAIGIFLDGTGGNTQFLAVQIYTPSDTAIKLSAGPVFITNCQLEATTHAIAIGGGGQYYITNNSLLTNTGAGASILHFYTAGATVTKIIFKHNNCYRIGAASGSVPNLVSGVSGAKIQYYQIEDNYCTNITTVQTTQFQGTAVITIGNNNVTVSTPGILKAQDAVIRHTLLVSSENSQLGALFGYFSPHTGPISITSTNNASGADRNVFYLMFCGRDAGTFTFP